MKTNPIDRRGFTLIELMIVIAIIGVLAVVATPSFRLYFRKVKAAEPRVLLQSIRALELSHQLEHGSFVTCPPTPARVPKGQPVPWPGGDCWRKLGFSPGQETYYQYAVQRTRGGFRAQAIGDLDGDGKTSYFSIGLQDTQVHARDELE